MSWKRIFCYAFPKYILYLKANCRLVASWHWSTLDTLRSPEPNSPHSYLQGIQASYRGFHLLAVYYRTFYSSLHVQIHITTGSHTILQVITMVKINILAAVSDKTFCLTTFQIVFFRTLYMKHSANKANTKCSACYKDWRV